MNSFIEDPKWNWPRPLSHEKAQAALREFVGGRRPPGPLHWHFASLLAYGVPNGSAVPILCPCLPREMISWLAALIERVPETSGLSFMLEFASKIPLFGSFGHKEQDSLRHRLNGSMQLEAATLLHAFAADAAWWGDFVKAASFQRGFLANGQAVGVRFVEHMNRVIDRLEGGRPDATHDHRELVLDLSAASILKFDFVEFSETFAVLLGRAAAGWRAYGLAAIEKRGFVRSDAPVVDDVKTHFAKETLRAFPRLISDVHAVCFSK